MMKKSWRKKSKSSRSISENQNGSPFIEEFSSNNSPAAESQATLTHSRSESGSRGSGSRTDNELLGYSDSNGQYFVMKQPSPAASDASNINGSVENVEISPIKFVSTQPNFSNSSSGQPVTKPIFNASATNLALPDSNGESKKWSKSPSSPALPVTSQPSQAGPVPKSAASTPTHAGSYQVDRLSPSLCNHESQFAFPDDVANDTTKLVKSGSRKKKRSPSWYNVISPSSKQKNENFHKTFKRIPDSEQLMLDYTCALMKDILVQGKLYATQNYVCFHSNILKWQTAIIMNFKDIEQISKEKTVKVFPNAIQIHVKGREKSPTFTSFTQRDRAFLLLNRLWQNAQRENPLPPGELLNGLRSNSSILISGYDDDSAKLDSPVKRHHRSNQTNNEISLSHLNQKLDDGDKMEREEMSDVSKSSSSYDSGDAGELTDEQDNVMPELDASGLPVFAKGDLQRMFLNREFNVPVETMFKTIFDTQCDFWKSYLLGKGSFDVVIGDWEEGKDDDVGDQIKYLSYHLSLTNPLGPKSAKCEETQTLYKESVPGYTYAVDGAARMINVPYANYFISVMRYCIRRVTDSSCQLRVTAQIDYRKTPWGLVKNFIEKNAYEGMEENFQLLERELDAYFQRHSHRLFYIAPGGDGDQSGKTKVRRRRKKNREETSSETPTPQSRPGTKLTTAPTISEPNHVNAVPSMGPMAVPLNDVRNFQNSYNAPIRQPMEPKSGKLYYLLIIIIFLSLLWSNYQMYHRLNVLEDLHSRVTPKQLYNAMSCENLHDGSQKVCNVANRVNRLETLIEKHVTASDTGWRNIIKEWANLRQEIDEAVKKIGSNDSN